MMTKANMIIIIRKGHHSLRIWLGNGKQTLQNIPHPFPQLALKLIKNDMRISFRHRRRSPLQIVPQYRPIQGKVGSRTQRQVTNDQTVRLPPRFLHHHQIGKIAGFTNIHQFVHSMTPPIDPRRIGNQQLHLLGKLLQPRRRSPTGRHAHPRIAPPGIAVLVVDVTRRNFRLGVLVIDLGFEFVVGGAEFRGEGFARGEGLADPAFLFVGVGVVGGEGFAVEVFAAEAGLAAVGGCLGRGGCWRHG
mmetsp:Transcript_13487/g.27410  ORF Transcript_13487/g.27410 Transcript_13487/m.27410 type:complete len:246 (+) Transcript_13487:283-1020(+)